MRIYESSTIDAAMFMCLIRRLDSIRLQFAPIDVDSSLPNDSDNLFFFVCLFGLNIKIKHQS